MRTRQNSLSQYLFSSRKIFPRGRVPAFLTFITAITIASYDSRPLHLQRDTTWRLIPRESVYTRSLPRWKKHGHTKIKAAGRLFLGALCVRGSFENSSDTFLDYAYLANTFNLPPLFCLCPSKYAQTKGTSEEKENIWTTVNLQIFLSMEF